MFASRFFANRFYAPHYFAKAGADAATGDFDVQGFVANVGTMMDR